MNKEQFHGWKNNPTTMEIMAKLEEVKVVNVENLGSGNTLCTTTDETALLTARIIGRIEGLNQILGLDYEEEDEIHSPGDTDHTGIERLPSLRGRGCRICLCPRTARR